MMNSLSNKSQEDLQVEALRALSAEIPLNDFGLPQGIYRTDLLPFHDYRPHEKPNSGNDKSHSLIILDDPCVSSPDDEETMENMKKWYEVEGRLGSPEEPEDTPDGSRVGNLIVAPQADPTEAEGNNEDYRIAGFPAQALSNAFVPLQYDEGFPAFASGLPFWGRLEYEPSDAYQAFDQYLHMSMGKNADRDEEEYNGEAAPGTRSLSTLVAQLHPDSKLLKMINVYQQYYHLYYWGPRAHAFDLFRVAQHRKQQELRAIETQDEHYVESKRLRHKLTAYFDDQENFWDFMTPKVAIDFFKTITQLERISSGVPAAGPMSEAREGAGGQPFEVAFRTIAQTNRSTAAGTTIDEEGKVLDKALEDPAVTEYLQELIIKTGG
ncbi:hypothetical protein LCGC14_1101660 [marine sediment metagenome]|uniref:Uncharacterized protein n=1 Tax=marine sediment metagenome TaxID=412755 RepID=A0A0F9MDU5_9ZZZZ